MEIESLRLDFLILILHIDITKAQNISEHIREGRKKKKTRRTQAVARDLGSAQPRSRVAQVARDPWVARSSGRARPRQRATWAAT